MHAEHESGKSTGVRILRRLRPFKQFVPGDDLPLGMGWHADDEKSIVPNSTIASVSLGAERIFHFKHKQTKQLIKIKLEHGSLLLMKGETQHHWLHALPKTTKVEAARINLTFRAMIV